MVNYTKQSTQSFKHNTTTVQVIFTRSKKTTTATLTDDYVCAGYRLSTHFQWELPAEAVYILQHRFWPHQQSGTTCQAGRRRLAMSSAQEWTPAAHKVILTLQQDPCRFHCSKLFVHCLEAGLFAKNVHSFLFCPIKGTTEYLNQIL